jgi:hypothetical protein
MELHQPTAPPHDLFMITTAVIPSLAKLTRSASGLQQRGWRRRTIFSRL